jgi:hypothetical protein
VFQDENEIISSAKETSTRVQDDNVGKQTSDYVASARENLSQTAQSVYTSAEQAARQYLPQGVVDKLEQAGVFGVQSEPSSHNLHSHLADSRPAEFASLPSHETGPFHPTHSGVGTLPGQPTESGVAKLPDERIEELRNELPTHESESFKPTYGGVGSLPGDKYEIGVAKLPDERVTEADENRTYVSGINGSQSQMLSTNQVSQLEGGDIQVSEGGVGSPGPKHEAGVVEAPDQRAQDINNEPRENQLGGFHPTHARGGVESLQGLRDEELSEKKVELNQSSATEKGRPTEGARSPSKNKEEAKMAAHTTSADAPVESVPDTKPSLTSGALSPTPPPPAVKPESGSGKHEEHSKVW